jgi:hypothetical protein
VSANNGQLSFIAHKVLAWNEHQDDVADGKRQREARHEREAFPSQIAKEDKI